MDILMIPANILGVTDPVPFRPEGFPGQHLVVLPESILLEMRRHPLLAPLFPTATGYFPSAPGHLVERQTGLEDLILIACLSGRGWVRLDSQPISVQADEALFIPPGTAHSYGADPNEPWSIMWVHFRGNDLGPFQALLEVTLATPLVCLPPGSFEQIGFSEIYQLLERDYAPTSLLTASARLRLLLAEIHRLRIPEHPGARSSQQGLQKTILWMRRNLAQSATLQELAQIAGLSQPHYRAIFRNKTGFPPIEYFLRMKIQTACRLLDVTDMRVEEIAAETGFQDPFYFSRVFKHFIGYSPRAYRKIPKG